MYLHRLLYDPVARTRCRQGFAGAILLLALQPACHQRSAPGDGGAPPAPSAGPVKGREAGVPPAASPQGSAVEPTRYPSGPAADRGFSVASVRAHGSEGRVQIYFVSEQAVLWLSVDLGERPGATFEAARLRDRQTAELVVGERARNVLPAGPALPPPEPRDRHLAAGGTIRVDRLGGQQLRVSALGLQFAGRPPVDLATRTVSISVPPP
ncbi:MAG: hypothetical protein JRI23_12820 [Deltaproteobacteria bacterium]|nr:hypothetical protein [Deltaproteobacteria bacterium]MBW2532597.1 hypothetical protein [Deltaproteobacteria bacterium]